MRYSFISSGKAAGVNINMITGCFYTVGVKVGNIFSGNIWCTSSVIGACTVRNVNGDRYFDSGVSGWNAPSIFILGSTIQTGC